jgi:glycosyltransferase involved in cell wall biosynthesis
MVILHIVSGLTPGGAELMMKRLIGYHLGGGGGYKHCVISLQTKATVGAQLESMGVEVVALGMRGPLSAPAAIVRLVREIRRLKPDLVQTWMYHADLIGGLAARMAGVRDVIWGVRATYLPHGHGTSPATTAIRTACAALSKHVPKLIVYVAESARLAHEGLGYDPRKSRVISNGYEMPPPPAGKQAQSAIRKRFGLPEEALLIGSAGRYNAVKDYPTFLAAAEKVAASRPEVQFVLAGRGLGPDNAELASSIREKGLAHRFHLLGEQQGLTDFLAAVDIFCLHSITEGFPNVVAEAMAMGVPCAVTDVGAAAVIVGDTGPIVPRERPDLLAQALEQLAAEGEDRRRERGQRARERIAANFSIEAIAANYEALYASLARSRQGNDQALPEARDKTQGLVQR